MTDRIIEVETSTRRFRIILPDDWTLTYGQAAPFTKVRGGGVLTNPSGMALRVYRGPRKDGKVVALYADVVAFRDTSLVEMIAAVRKFGLYEDNDWYADDGTWTGEHAKEVARSWLPESEVTPGVPPWHWLPSAEDPDPPFVSPRRAVAVKFPR